MQSPQQLAPKLPPGNILSVSSCPFSSNCVTHRYSEGLRINLYTYTFLPTAAAPFSNQFPGCYKIPFSKIANTGTPHSKYYTFLSPYHSHRSSPRTVPAAFFPAGEYTQIRHRHHIGCIMCISIQRCQYEPGSPKADQKHNR